MGNVCNQNNTINKTVCLTEAMEQDDGGEQDFERRRSSAAAYQASRQSIAEPVE